MEIKMKKFEYEKAEQIFVKLLGGKLINIDEHGFSREFAFNALGVDYKVTWYHNQSYLLVNGLQVMFFDCEISNTWPSPAGAKSKLQFRDACGNCVAVIVLEWR
jgi:hypothetical protein